MCNGTRLDLRKIYGKIWAFGAAAAQVEMEIGNLGGRAWWHDDPSAHRIRRPRSNHWRAACRRKYGRWGDQSNRMTPRSQLARIKQRVIARGGPPCRLLCGQGLTDGKQKARRACSFSGTDRDQAVSLSKKKVRQSELWSKHAKSKGINPWDETARPRQRDFDRLRNRHCNRSKVQTVCRRTTRSRQARGKDGLSKP